MRFKRMTARKLFAGLTLTSLVGVTVVGGVFAWRTADSARGAAVVGENVFEIRYRPVCDADAALTATDPETGDTIPCLTLIGWNGQATKVGEGNGVNNGNFPLSVVGGRVDIRAVLATEDAAPVTDVEPEDLAESEVRGCAVGDFSGEVRIESPGEVIPPGGEGGKFAAALKVSESAPRSCQGDIVIYRVTIVAENPNGPTDPLTSVR